MADPIDPWQREALSPAQQSVAGRAVEHVSPPAPPTGRTLRRRTAASGQGTAESPGREARSCGRPVCLSRNSMRTGPNLPLPSSGIKMSDMLSSHLAGHAVLKSR